MDENLFRFISSLDFPNSYFYSKSKRDKTGNSYFHLELSRVS